MGKKLDAFLRRRTTFKTGKFKAAVKLALSRLSVLKNQRQARRSVARSDVVQLLTLGQHERALFRVEQVVKEQNMLDVYVLIEGFSLLLIERVFLFEQDKNCPEELKEAVSSLIFASSRCGDFPELQEIRALFTSRFGKEFVGRAIELRNNCGVNHKMIQKLSTRTPSLEDKFKMLKEIASEEDIVLQLEQVALEKPEEKLHKPSYSGDFMRGGGIGGGGSLPVGIQYEKIEGFSDSVETRRKYKDVADAAQAAFESAAYAAAAAKAAVELSRSDSQDPDDPSNSNWQPSANETTEYKPHFAGARDLRRNIEDQEHAMRFDKIHPISQNYSSESDDGLAADDKMGKRKQGKNESELKRSPSSSSTELLDDGLNENMYSGEDLLMKLNERELVFDESEDESRGETKTDLKLEKMPEKKSSFAEKIGTPDAGPLVKNKMPISVRTRTFGR